MPNSTPPLTSSEIESTRDFWKGFWRLADPKISLASMASIFLGACAAGSQGELLPAWLALTVLGIFAIEVAKNASGEIVDFNSGADSAVPPEDRTPYSGGKRVLVDGLLTRGDTILISWLGYLIGAGIGFYIAAVHEPKILWIGIVGMLCAYLYHAAPLRLSYHGLGETAVAICYGPLIATGTYLVQRHVFAAEILLVSVPLGLVIGAFLWINEFPDYSADRKARKRTLVVRLGRRRASRVFAWILGAAFGWIALLPLGGLPTATLFGLAGAIPAVIAARRLWRSPEETQAIIPAQTQTLISFLLLSIGTGIGLLLG